MRVPGRSFPRRQAQPWLIIFVDMITLMLTFFVILTAVSVVNERSLRRAVASVRGAFGLGEHTLWQDEQREGSPGRVLPRPLGPYQAGGRARSESRLFADNPHIAVRYTETEVILSMPEDLLFSEGGAEPGPEGREALDRLMPFLRWLTYPALVGGHSAPGYGEGARPFSIDARAVDFSWALSLDRALAVYRHFASRGADAAMLRVEAYGRHRPDSDNLTPEGRRRNRRIELVIDRRNPGLRALPGDALPRPEQGREYHFRDFLFNLDIPGGDRAGGGD